MSTSSNRREGRRRKSAAPEMWLPNNWGLADSDAFVLSTNEEEDWTEDGKETHPFFSIASTSADPVAPSRDSILVIPPLCFSDRCCCIFLLYPGGFLAKIRAKLKVCDVVVVLRFRARPER